MIGSFLNKYEMYDLKKSEERTNAIKKRENKENYHVETIVCGCPCPTCGGWHQIIESRPLPSIEECEEILKDHNKKKKKNKNKRITKPFIERVKDLSR